MRVRGGQGSDGRGSETSLRSFRLHAPWAEIPKRPHPFPTFLPSPDPYYSVRTSAGISETLVDILLTSGVRRVGAWAAVQKHVGHRTRQPQGRVRPTSSGSTGKRFLMTCHRIKLADPPLLDGTSGQHCWCYRFGERRQEQSWSVGFCSHLARIKGS